MLEDLERMAKMQSDNIKLWFTYGIALLVIVGGGIMLFIMRLDGPSSNDLQLAIVGFIGGALAFVFNRETATQATRAAESSARAGVDSQTPRV